MNVFLEDYNSIIKENEKKMFADISYNLLISENQGGIYLYLISIVPYVIC